MDRTTAQILGAMDDSHRVQIIGYQGDSPGDLVNWPTPNQMATMNVGNQQAASDFVTRISRQFDGGTPTEMALQAALAYDSEAIILLSDGKPNNDVPDSIISRITAANGGKKEIHSVAIGDYNEEPELVDFLTKLASENDGQFIGVSK